MDTRHVRSILVPMDGSAAADAAFALALRLAAPDGEVIVTHVIDRATIAAECVTPYGGDPTPVLAALDEDEETLLERAREQAHAANVRCLTLAADGNPIREICSLARQRKVDAIAMGTHGRRGLARLILGNTAAGVLHQTDVPTFVVHEESAELAARPFRQILVALDPSAGARNAVRAAIDLAAHDGGAVFFAHVAERDDGAAERQALQEGRRLAHAAHVSTDAATLGGDPVEALLVAAETMHANLIAVGAHRNATGGFRMGSVAEAIARTSPVPVLVVPVTPVAAAAR
ncbi:MAG TPA: universal stress protein [Candidatus Sulfotelmatobacter sp.]|nr:universal stress protein [Candidatus Sulfotelmatobacter sp.]